MMRQEAGNLGSGAISPSFDLGQEHTEEASRADTAQGEVSAPSKGVKPSSCLVVADQWVLAEQSLLLQPEPLCLPKSMCVHRAHFSSTWLWPPLDTGDVLRAPAVGMVSGVRAVSACRQYTPARLREVTGGKASFSPISHQGGHRFKGQRLESGPTWSQGCGYLRGTFTFLSHTPAAPAWSRKEADECPELPRSASETDRHSYYH